MRTTTMHATLLLTIAACGSRPSATQVEANQAAPEDAAMAEPEAAATADTPLAGFEADLAGLADALPPGWSFAIRESGAPATSSWSAVLTFDNPGMDCVIRFGQDRANSRTEHPRVSLTVYRAEDAAALHAAEEPYRELSSHCPRDLPLAETSRYFVAVSPCDRAFAMDDSCARAVEELEADLRAFFGRSQ